MHTHYISIPTMTSHAHKERDVPHVKIVGEKEGVSLAAFSHTQWGNTHKGGG